MNLKRPFVLSIAAFDPSAGAGILADIKTLEQHKIMGMGVLTGLTYQNEDEFIGVNWVSAEDIRKQLDILFKKFNFDVIKIGMAKNLETIDSIVSYIKSHHSNAKIIWDPILKASAGFKIHHTIDKEKVVRICKNIYLLTPNADEIKTLSGELNVMNGAKNLSKYCHILLKGGHNQEQVGRDYLFTLEEKEFSFKPKNISIIGKHGSGCVLSSAIAAELAKGSNLQRSCLKAKDYVTKFMTSSKTLLGYHKL